MKGSWAARGACLLGCLAGLLMFAAPACAATATERVSDGGFDLMPCAPTGCVGSSWSQGGTTDGNSAVIVGPICSATVTGCAVASSGYHTPFHWARIGRVSQTGSHPAQVDTWIQQDVMVPASFPPAPLATLHFVMRILQESGSDENLTISLGGREVTRIQSNDARFTGSYTQVDVPLDSFVGPGVQPLRFEATGFYQEPVSTSFDIDDVSVTAPDALAPVAAPTGQRAAALAKCKHKHGKKRKKCRKRANQLPL